MESFEPLGEFAPLLARMNLEQIAQGYPEAAYVLVQYLSEEVQAADGKLRMIWEQVPAGFAIGRA
jgi:hypothetical protein